MNLTNIEYLTDLHRYGMNPLGASRGVKNQCIFNQILHIVVHLKVVFALILKFFIVMRRSIGRLGHRGLKHL